MGGRHVLAGSETGRWGRTLIVGRRDLPRRRGRATAGGAAIGLFAREVLNRDLARKNVAGELAWITWSLGHVLAPGDGRGAARYLSSVEPVEPRDSRMDVSAWMFCMR